MAGRGGVDAEEYTRVLARMLGRAVRPPLGLRMAAWGRTKQLWVFFLLPFGLAWLPVVASERGLVGWRLPRETVWVGGVAPVAASVLVEGLARGWAGVRPLSARFSVRAIPLRWLLAAGELPACIVVLQAVARGAPLTWAALGQAAVVPVRGVLFAPLAAIEEAGSRGLALPRLQVGHDAAARSTAKSRTRHVGLGFPVDPKEARLR